VAWLNDNGAPTDINRFRSNRIRIRDLLNGSAPLADADDEPVAPFSGPTAAVPTAGGVRGIGIDIQARSSMPEAEDFRSDPFYTDNFSPRELAHCLQQRDPLLSLAGIWAAKEAVLKAGAGSQGKRGLANIEIAHDATGAPVFSNCLLSISHDHGVAVAVCIRLT